MQVFKLYFKLLRANMGIIIMYFAIFFGVALVMTGNLASDGKSAEDTRLNIAIIDEDGVTIGNALKEYFGEIHNLKEVEYDKQDILDALYWRRLDYVLVIPDGFEKSLLDDSVETIKLQSMKVPGIYDATYFESELSMYTSKLTGLLKAGYGIEEAEKQLKDLQDATIEPQIASFVNKKQNDVSTLFFAYAPYLFITLGINGVGLIMLTFNEQKVRERMECSATTMKQRIVGLTGGIMVFGVILLGAVIVAAGVLSKGKIYTDSRFPYFFINIVAMLLFGLSLGFFTGTVAKTLDAVNGLVNIFSLALCFLGGVFVPQEFFSDTIINVAKFFPTYWYVQTNTSIGAMKELTPELTGDIVIQVGLVLGYALTVFAVTIVILSNKRKRVA